MVQIITIPCAISKCHTRICITERKLRTAAAIIACTIDTGLFGVHYRYAAYLFMCSGRNIIVIEVYAICISGRALLVNQTQHHRIRDHDLVGILGDCVREFHVLDITDFIDRPVSFRRAGRVTTGIQCPDRLEHIVGVLRQLIHIHEPRGCCILTFLAAVHLQQLLLCSKLSIGVQVDFFQSCRCRLSLVVLVRRCRIVPRQLPA